MPELRNIRVSLIFQIIGHQKSVSTQNADVHILDRVVPHHEALLRRLTNFCENLPVIFWIGLAVGCLLYIVNFPVMTLGLGVYLPFYLSLTAFIGGAVRFIVQKAAPAFEKKGTAVIIASGLLGGEAVLGVIIAIVQAAQGMAAM